MLNRPLILERPRAFVSVPSSFLLLLRLHANLAQDIYQQFSAWEGIANV